MKNWICELVCVGKVFLEGKLKTKLYISLPKIMVEICFMTQEKYENVCAELTGGMYEWANDSLLYFVRFCE